MGKPSLRSESLPVVASLLPGSPPNGRPLRGRMATKPFTVAPADQTIGLYYTTEKLSSSGSRFSEHRNDETTS